MEIVTIVIFMYQTFYIRFKPNRKEFYVISNSYELQKNAYFVIM